MPPTPRKAFLAASRAITATATLTLVGLLATASIQVTPDHRPGATTPDGPSRSEAPGTADTPNTADEVGRVEAGADHPSPPSVADPPSSAKQLTLLAYRGLPAMLVEPGHELPQVAQDATLTAIPDSALAAYQRATSIINAAQPHCGLKWPLLAATGQIASEHGQGSSRQYAPKATEDRDRRQNPQPGDNKNAAAQAGDLLVGAPLLGPGGKPAADTDEGRLDGDTLQDRPVGPMMLPPETWTVVGVDANDDGRRDPHDIADAALAAAVILCTPVAITEVVPGAQAATDVLNAIATKYRRQQEHDDTTIPVIAQAPGPEGDSANNPGAGSEVRSDSTNDGSSATAIRHGPRTETYGIPHLADVSETRWPAPPTPSPGWPTQNPWPNDHCPTAQPGDPPAREETSAAPARHHTDDDADGPDTYTLEDGPAGDTTSDSSCILRYHRESETSEEEPLNDPK